MKENPYDNEQFFQEYSRFPRSVEGLNAAGEWHELKKMLPDFQGKRVLDIGCGFGWHCVYASENEAKQVIGTDISEKMLAVAKEKNNSSKIEYRHVAMEDLEFQPGSFDVVISSLALHYTPDFELVCNKVADCLVKGGDFVFSVEHPIFTAHGLQDWIYGDDNSRKHWPVDSYFIEGERNSIFLGNEVVKYHKTLTTYLNTLLKTGYIVTGVVEPKPGENLLDSVPGMKDELRRPMMLIISAKKA